MLTDTTVVLKPFFSPFKLKTYTKKVPFTGIGPHVEIINYKWEQKILSFTESKKNRPYLLNLSKGHTNKDNSQKKKKNRENERWWEKLVSSLFKKKKIIKGYTYSFF